MNERERVLDLVKKGVLSTEEALDLLESMASAKDEKQIAKENEAVTEKAGEATPNETTTDPLDKLLNGQETADPVETLKEQEAEAKKNLESILDDLATEANQASAELDEINVEIDGVRTEIAEAQNQLMELNTKEELGILTETELTQRQEIEAEIKALEASAEELLAEKANLEAQLRDVKRDQWAKTKDKIAEKLELPDDWKDQATDAINQASEKMAEAGTYLGKFLKQTFQSVTDAVNDNVEWKDISVKMPGMASTKFEHTFEYPESAATILDVKVANGNVQFMTWDQPGVKVEAQIKLYGKMENDPLDSFNERSQIEVDDDHILFQVPNKRVRADLTFYLPQRTYDHVSVKLLNGNILVNELDAKDVYSKSTNGNIDFKGINATMLEIEGVNGNINVGNGEIMDAIIETVNGNITMTTTPQTVGATLVHGDIRLTFKDTDLKKLNVSTVNGTIKLALPAGLGIEGEVKTSLGAINSRMTGYEVVREQTEKMNQMLQFRRVLGEELAQIEMNTTTGNIYLKDTDK